MAIQTFTAGQVLTAAQMNSLQANDYNQTVSTKTANYVLVAADKGTRIEMNKSGAGTVTVNTGLFSAGDTLIISNISADAVTVTAGTATVVGQNLVIPQYGQGTLFFSSASASIFFLAGSGTSYGTATGGIGSPTAVTIGGVNYQYLQFNSTGTLTVTKAGFFDYCAVGGGGGLLYGVSYATGGGGAGQIRFGSVYLDANQTITIGAGGAKFIRNINSLTQGGDTTIAATSPFTQVALGNVNSDENFVIKTFVGGGLGCMGGVGRTAQTGSVYNGYQGGNSTATSNGGGGGGSTAAGGNGATTVGGAAGAGTDVAVFIGGSELRKAMGGGGGGSGTGGAAATGGVAGSTTTTGNNGNANSGGGAGGTNGDPTAPTGNGGSGIVYIRWKV
jgi:hypothetical protein